MQASGMRPGLVEQRLQGSLIKAVTGIAELAVHPDLAALFGQQREGILASQADQRITRRSEEHTSELQSRENLVCRLLLEKKKENHHGLHADAGRLAGNQV